MESSRDVLHALALLLTANATPVIVAKLVDQWAAFPLDFGYVMADGERLLGAHKTWRGLVSGIAACTLLAWLFGLPLWLGAGFASASLFADAVSSFAKRRLKLRSGAEFVALDQLGETLLPLALFAGPLALAFGEVVLVAAIFVVIDIVTMPMRQRRWLRSRILDRS